MGLYTEHREHQERLSHAGEGGQGGFTEVIPELYRVKDRD